MSIIVWYRNDLRVHDHEPLWKASQKTTNVFPVYIFDPRQFEELSVGFSKTGWLRTQFLIESVQNLRKNLQSISSGLIVRVGKPEEILPRLAIELEAEAVYCSEEVTSEETGVDAQVEEALQTMGKSMSFFWTSTLFHIDDLPFDIDQLPDVFTQFRNRVEKSCKVRSCFDTPYALLFKTNVSIGTMPTAESLLGYTSDATTHYVGGEDAANQRLKEYIWEQDLLKVYKETRNEMLGMDFSSKFSVWLANGCISPRHIYQQAQEYEYQRVKNDSTYWLIFELLWRDYFRFVSMKYGDRIFSVKGIKQDQHIQLSQNKRIFELWKNGETGIPLIDANMKELLATGFMSNRGRQNVASFLVKDLKIDWTWGASWFESQLLDYDVCSNWGNWNYVAGVGNDPRENRYFNILTQATRYDSQGEYVIHWLPALASVPADKVHLISVLPPLEQQKYNVQVGVNFPKALFDVNRWRKK
ncbi:DASH family cryptochrome [Flectobacillus sp. DC10W]|uniref:Cryptochrome DASH n=1 Tax=Flectobacillus longus TaxID=2984207 RepID=A0ABT6YMJ3_9BACT|nr:DASH family cryptochrome [Flectobacillus longus]MDI9864745.1 DASH family cryptochrome [Flectobacillus longus]